MSRIKELSYTQLKKECDPTIFKFKTTRELEPFTGTIGQARGIKAIELKEPQLYKIIYDNSNDKFSLIIKNIQRVLFNQRKRRKI